MRDRYIFVFFTLVCFACACTFALKEAKRPIKNVQAENVVSMEKDIKGISQKENFLPLSPRTYNMVFLYEEREQMRFTSLKENFRFSLPGKNTLFFIEGDKQNILLGVSKEEAQEQLDKLNFEVAWANFTPWLAFAVFGCFPVAFGILLKDESDKTWPSFIAVGAGCLLVFIFKLIIVI